MSVFEMIDTYEDRKVDRYDGEDGLFISTALVTDSKQPYETGICHPAYNDGEMVIVEMYDTKEDSQVGHDRWVLKMTAEELPSELIDVSTSMTAKFSDIVDDDWRIKRGTGI